MKSAPALPWAATPATLRREPTAGELASGIPCGPADQKMFNELFYRAFQGLIEIQNVVAHAGLTPSDSVLTQLRDAIDILIAANSPTMPTSGEGVEVDGSNHVNLKFQSLPPGSPTGLDLFAYFDVEGSAYQNITRDALIALISNLLLPSVLNIQQFTFSGSYTPTTGTRRAIAFITGGGGGGGASYGSGGGGAETALAHITAPTTTAFTIGAGGAAGIVGSAPGIGGDGGETSFGSITAKGGKGGGSWSNGQYYSGAGGSGGAGGLTRFAGTAGGVMGGATGGQTGGGSYWGGGGNSKSNTGSGTGPNIPAGSGDKGGGGGGGSGAPPGDGGAGGNGYIIVFEFA
jgi:hypothetical protein